MAKEKRLSKIKARQMKADEEDRKRFNIVGHRKIWYILSLLVIIPGIFCMFTRGFNFGIDFTGGTIIDLRFDKEVAITEVRDVLKEYKLDNSTIQLSGDTSSATAAKDVMIRTGDLEENERKAVMASLKDKLGNYTMLREEKVGAVIGSELVWNAIWATLLSWVLIVLYVSFRFEWKFGIAAVLALVHDVLILLSVFSLLQKQLDSSFVAAYDHRRLFHQRYHRYFRPYQRESPHPFPPGWRCGAAGKPQRLPDSHPVPLYCCYLSFHYLRPLLVRW